MATVLSRPKFFDQLDFTRSAPDAGGRYTATAPCGCEQHRRIVTEEPLAGHAYGDGQYIICDSHCRECEECGQQTYPHMDCLCGCDEPQKATTY